MPYYATVNISKTLEENMKTFGNLVSKVSAVFQDLKNMKLLNDNEYTTRVSFNDESKDKLFVTVNASSRTTLLCLMMFNDINSMGYNMDVTKNDNDDPLSSILSVTFYV